ncbi:helix-turn-helix domain-containing protein [Cytobacillus horneckiae]|uniref:XRE family transcriptional regulator n=1 Tax=Cytobacillus horneckiae TaxID=549687 RepID=A0A2N0ZB14_9BACI|nr:helix-turn-helix transcriptional regulator [Cytobacillus horneckiae]MEC1158689.1 helix-turn-helix transcriptional regulator [Cytobacillus horneckiae]NRG46647.1 helix-turn-helix transcriptional regulator [Bacillus sp. CRN 9]PKG26702.1 XRE family transcriptional regulator [Cytobacillus horneckiae]
MAEATIKRINDLCKQKNINIYNLALMSDVSQSTLNEIMHGRSKHPRIITLKKVANGLGMTLSEFFDDEIFDQISNLEDKATNKNKKETNKDKETN